MKKILLIDTIHNALIGKLEQAGFSVVDGTHLTKEEASQVLQEYEGIVIRSRFSIDSSFLHSAAKLRFIARAGAGMENIDVAAAESKAIICVNAPEANRDAVGEHAVAMLLCLFNRILIADREVRSGKWLREENRGVELHGKTVGIIGFGNMGSAFAEKISGFSCRILAYDKYKTISKGQYSFVEQVEMQSIFDETDIVSLHVPLTEETQSMVNSGYLNRFRKKIYIINTARGAVVNTSSLVEALKNGSVSGACLDVLEFESTSFEHIDRMSSPEWDYISACENVILSPHVAGWSFESHQRISEILAEKILKIYSA